MRVPGRERRSAFQSRVHRRDPHYFPWATDLEIVSEDADKGEALLDLAAELGIQAGEVMAMGDGNNDLGLMRAAGLSVAMGNSDHEVIAAADHITADNEHDGVAEAILKFVL